VKERLCSRDIELLAVSMQPYYLPQGFSSPILIGVYIPPSASGAAACDTVHTTIARLQSQNPEAFVAITGDFNHVQLQLNSPNFPPVCQAFVAITGDFNHVQLNSPNFPIK